MGAKQLTEAIRFAKQLGYPSGSTVFWGGPDDYLYCYQTICKLKYAATWRIILVSQSWRPCFQPCPPRTFLIV
jgi:hypothetical protein